MSRPRIQVRIDSEHKTAKEVRLEDLNALCSRLAKALKATEHALSGTTKPGLDYRLVGLKHGSATLEVQLVGEAALENETAELFQRTVEALESGGQLDPRLARQDIEYYQRLGDLPGVKLSIGSSIVSEAYRRRVKEHLNREVTSEGSIRGLVKRLDLSTKPFHFDLFPIGAKRKVTCRFGESLLESARLAIGRTASVYGRVVYWGHEPAPVRVDVERLEVKRGAATVKFTDLRGAFTPEATGGLSAVDFVRSLRDQE